MEPTLHTEYLICENLMISIKGEAFGIIAKKDVGQFSLYFMSHKWKVIVLFIF